MRPRQFDEDAVLGIAFEQFWRRGVRGASLSDIARAAGVQRGSLYNAFGAKEALFLTAYERHARDYLAAIGAALAEGPLRARLTAFFDVAIASFCAGTPARGCPTTRALMEIPSTAGAAEGAARAAFAALLRGVIARVEAALEDGAGRGEFTGNPARAAAHLVTVARGLVVLERAFGDEAELRAIAAEAIEAALTPRG